MFGGIDIELFPGELIDFIGEPGDFFLGRLPEFFQKTDIGADAGVFHFRKDKTKRQFDFIQQFFLSVFFQFGQKRMVKGRKDRQRRQIGFRVLSGEFFAEPHGRVGGLRRIEKIGGKNPCLRQ